MPWLRRSFFIVGSGDGGVPTYTVHLQFVDPKRRALTLIAPHVAIHGPQQY